MEPTIETLTKRPLLGIRAHVKVTQIGERIGELMPRLMAVAGPHVAGPPVARWHTWENDEGEMELAVPVRTPVEGRGEVQASTLPGGRAAVFTHVGSYEGLKDAWGGVSKWLQSSAYQGRDAPWEEYVDDGRSTPVERLRTRIVWPIV